MEYSKLQWNHTSPNEPVEILSEYDNGWEVRKIEVFLNGSVTYADSESSVGETKLSLIERPSDDDVDAHPEFKVLPLSKSEFEQAWSRARRSASANGKSAS